MNAQPEMTPAEKILAFAEAQGLTMTAEFVPYSIAKATRSDWNEGPGGKPWVGLTWRVTIYRGHGTPLKGVPGKREVLTTTYSAGIAHCPGYKASKASLSAAPYSEQRARDALCAWECEHGKAGRYSTIMGGRDNITAAKAAPILPALVDVLWSLSMDAGVLDEGGFEPWAESLGYDTDSQKAEGIYRRCLETALKLRAALGDAGLSELREAGQDY